MEEPGNGECREDDHERLGGVRAELSEQTLQPNDQANVDRRQGARQQAIDQRLVDQDIYILSFLNPQLGEVFCQSLIP